MIYYTLCAKTKKEEEKFMSSKLKNDGLLVLTALIWGSSFVAQRVGMDHLGPFTFNSIRCLMGALVLVPLIIYRKKKLSKSDVEVVKEDKKALITGGILCGIAMAVASSLQQFGLVYTTAGKAGFITALYILIVPILGLFIGKKVGKKVWIGVAFAVVGMYLLCINEGFSISKGDTLVILCAVAFSIHILLIDHFSPKVDGVKLSCIQFAICGVLCAFPMFANEAPKMANIMAAMVPLLYAGVLSCGVAYTLQIIAQKNTDPTVASLILSLESVFAVLASWIVIHEALSIREVIGCVLMFVAIILAQLPEKKQNQ